jgi:hypothetical protein
MAYIALLFLLNYLTVGRAYEGWASTFCTKRKRGLKIDEDPRKTAVKEQLGVQPRDREEGLSVMVMTDSEFEQDIKPIRTMYANMTNNNNNNENQNRLLIQDKNSEYSEIIPFHKKSDFPDQTEGFGFGTGGGARLGGKGVSHQGNLED